ncbi:MAG TPA: hypothetical protein VN048_10660 [Verrucomicrobiae bacterium]|nr:hypothetical protein [Verrucomicrobiae bacterium]
MKTMTRCKILLAFLGLMTVPAAIKGDTIINNFNNGFDYMANGVPGTMWDGVYLGFGDVFGGSDGGDIGVTLQANETANPGFLTIQDNFTDWAGANDDGFFLYKVVAGDFDVSVENVEPFDNSDPANNHMGGLMARAFPTNGPRWSAPFNGAENWQAEFRFQAFNIDEDIRFTTNGADHDAYITVPGINTNNNINRYLRITRVGNVFSFYTKTNQPDAWTLHGSLTRGDLAGVPIQVGLADATFGDGTGGGAQPPPVTFYTDFELTGTNVVAAPTLPANPTGLASSVTSVTNQTYTWTPGAGSAGSVLVLRQDNPLSLQQKPINGYTYTASNHFGSGDDLGGGIYVVFAGAGNSVTVSGLSTTNHTYYAAVYSYSGSGASTVYGAAPATESNVGPNQYVAINFTTKPTLGVSVGGIALPFLTANDAFGDTDSVPSGNAIWSSTANTIATVSVDGTINGVGVGTVQIIASYSGLSVTNSVTVHAPAYTDSFGTSHDYLANGLPGTTWNGLYLKGSDIPNASYNPPLAKTTVFNANTTSNDVLSITAANSGWQGAQDNGPFLFQNVPGDFEASVHITGYSILNYEFVGLQARAYSLADNASPSGPGFSENFVDWLRFDEFSVTTSTFNTLNGGNTETDNKDGETNNYWLLMVRDSGTNFYFFKKANLTDPWKFQPTQTIIRPDLAGVPLQVGLVQSMFTGTFGQVQFDSFALDAANISGGTPPSATRGFTIALNPTYTQATLNWIPGTNSNGSVQTTMVIMRKGAPVTAQPYFGILTGTPGVPDTFGDSTDFGGGNFLVYRGTGSNTVVNGLVPGVQYYAAVYGFSSSSTTKSFNLLGSASAVTPPVALTGITATLPGTGIPVNGIGLPVVTGQILGGGTLDVSTGAVITSGNSNIMVSTSGVITGLAIGTATNTVTVVNGTNTFNTTLVATVRAPSYTDNFGTSHDYVANGATNSSWDGVYAYPKFTIPDTTFVSDGSADVFTADANVTSNNVLTITSENVGFENPQDDGFFLFKYVPDDFQMAVHISASLLDTNGAPIAAYNYPGLLARPYRISTNGIPGAPFYTNVPDSFVTWARFDEFGIGTRAELIIRGGTTSLPSADVGDEQRWLLMVRHNGTNFTFYQKANLTDPWQPGPTGQQFNVTNFVNLPMQVGIMEGGFDSGNVVTGQFDSFSLDLGQPILDVSSSGRNIILSWPALSGYTLQSTLGLAPSSWQPVLTSPTTVDGLNTVTLPATNNAAYFRLVH